MSKSSPCVDYLKSSFWLGYRLENSLPKGEIKCRSRNLVILNFQPRIVYKLSIQFSGGLIPFFQKKNQQLTTVC